MVVHSMEAVLVRGHIPRSLLVFSALAVVGAIAGVIVSALNLVLGWILAVASALLLVILQVIMIVRKRRQCWITDTGSGFNILDREGNRTFHDDDVFGIDLEIIQVFSQGAFKGFRRIFRVKVEGRPKSIEMRNSILVGQADPLHGLIDRLVNQYRERAIEALEAGVLLEGKDWNLSHSRLTVKSQPDQVAQIEELDSVDVFDSKVCVWKKGVDEAFLQTPVRSPNAFLLQLLLQRIIAERDSDDRAVAPEGFGRVLFERKGKKFWFYVLGGLALFLGAPVIVLVVFVALGNMQGDFESAGVAAIFMIISALCALAAASNRRSVFRCHERGVFMRSLFSESQFRYEDVREFTYSATRQYYNGVYVGTVMQLKLVPDPGTGAEKIKYSTTVKNADDSLENLRDHISRVVASRLLDELSKGNRVQWTPNLVFLPDGIEYRPGGFLGRKEAQILRFNELHGFDIQEGTFHLWARNIEKSVMQESIGATNFFPGYYALINLCAA